MRTPIAGLLSMLLFGWSATALAGFVEFSDRTAWDAAVSDQPLEIVGWDAYTLPPGGFTTGWDGTDGIGDDITFVNGAGFTPAIFTDTWVGPAGTIGLGSGNVLASNAGINVSFLDTVTGIGVDLRGYAATATTFAITLGSGDVFSPTVSNPVGGFWGVTSTEAISSIFITTSLGGSATVMDNFTIAKVPAPGGLVLLVGLAGLVLIRRGGR